MPDDRPQREATLQEYVEQLPSIHLARREYAQLIDTVRGLVDGIAGIHDNHAIPRGQRHGSTSRACRELLQMVEQRHGVEPQSRGVDNFMAQSEAAALGKLAPPLKHYVLKAEGGHIGATMAGKSRP